MQEAEVPKILHRQSSIQAVQLSEVSVGDVCRTRKETSPTRYIMRIANAVAHNDATGQTVEILGIDIVTGEPILFDHQVIVLPPDDELVLRNI